MLDVPTKYMFVIQLLFLIGHLYLIGVWLSEGRTNKQQENTCSKDIGLYSQILSTTPHLIVNSIERTYVFG